MKRTIVLILACFIFLSAAFPQNPDRRASSSISVSFLGHSPSVGLNYDQLVLRKDNFNLGFRLGLPFYNPFTQVTFQEPGGQGVTGGLNFLYGCRSAHAEVSVNGGVFKDSFREDHGAEWQNGASAVASAYAGFRYQRPSGGFFMKVGFSPSVFLYAGPGNRSAFYPLPGLELGYNIPNHYQHPGVLAAQEKRKEAKNNREPFASQLHLQVFAGVEFAGYESRGNWRNGGQGGGTSAGLRESTVRPAFSPSLLLEWRMARHFALLSGFEFRSEAMDVNWYASSWAFNPDYGDPYTSGTMDLIVQSLRIPLYGKFTFGGQLEGAVMAGPYLNFKLGHRAEGAGVYGDNNSGPVGFPVVTAYLEELPLVGDGLVPPGFRLGLSGGLETRYHLSEKHSILFRAIAGRDFTRQFSFPGFSMIWCQVQAGYALRLK